GFLRNTLRVLGALGVSMSPRSLVPAAASRRRRTPRRIQTPSAPRSQSFSGLPRNTLRVLGDLGVSIVSAISRPRCSVEEAEDAETDSNAERAEVAELFWASSKYSPRPRRSRRFDRLRDLLSPFPRRGHGVFWSSSTKLSACSAISAFRSSPRSLVPAAASRRRRTPRRIQTPSAPRSQLERRVATGRLKDRAKIERV